MLRNAHIPPKKDKQLRSSFIWSECTQNKSAGLTWSTRRRKFLPALNHLTKRKLHIKAIEKKLNISGSMPDVRPPHNLYQRLLSLLSSQKRNLKNVSGLLFVNFAVAGVGFITQLKIANVFGREEFGLIAYGMAIAAYGGVMVRFGMDRTLVRDLTHFPGRFTAIVKASLALRFALLTLVIAAIITWKLAFPAESDLTWGVVLIIIANTAMSVDLQGVFDSWHKMTRHALFNLLQRGLYFAAIWTLLFTAPGLLSVFTVGVVSLVSVTVYLALQYIWVMRRLPSINTKEKIMPMALKLARGNVVVWVAALLGLSFGTFNQLALKHYQGSAELGGYAAAWMIVSLSSMLLTQVARVGNPATARITAGVSTKKQHISFLLKYSVLMVGIVLPVALPAIAAPALILEMIFHPEYISAAPALRILGIYVIVFSIGLVASQYVVSARMEKIYLSSVIIGGAVSILTAPMLTQEMKSTGAAVSLLIAHGTSIALYWTAIIHRIVKWK